MDALLTPEPLTREAFAPFGEVIETAGAEPVSINRGLAQRYADLARIDVGAEGGRPVLSIFRAQPTPPPIRLILMERHPLGSQAIVPLKDWDWIVVVASGDDPVDPRNLRAFRASGGQGINYRRNVWHHPLNVLRPDHDFLVVDRGGAGANLEERPFPGGGVVLSL